MRAEASWEAPPEKVIVLYAKRVGELSEFLSSTGSEGPCVNQPVPPGKAKYVR